MCFLLLYITVIKLLLLTITGKGANGVGDSVTSNKGNTYDTKPSSNHKTTTGKADRFGEPNSSIDILDDFGNVKTRRWYDADGKAIRDIDITNHGNPKQHPEWPHEHRWQWDGNSSKRN